MFMSLFARFDAQLESDQFSVAEDFKKWLLATLDEEYANWKTLLLSMIGPKEAAAAGAEDFADEAAAGPDSTILKRARRE